MKTKQGISRFRMRLMKIIDASFGHWLCWILGYMDYLDSTKLQPLPATAPGRILVVRPGGVGDMILLLPVLKRLAENFPSAQIDIICEKRNIDVLRLAGLEKNALAYDTGIFHVIGLLRRRKYDIAIDTEQFHNFSAIIAFLSRAPVRIGFKINPHRNLLYTHLVNYSMDGYEGEQFARLLAPAGAGEFTYKLEGAIPAPETIHPSREREQMERLGRRGKVVTMHAGSTSIYKQWDTGKFTELARTLISGRGCSIALLGDQNDACQADLICKGSGATEGRIASFAGKFSLLETAATIARSNLFISGDSGLAHLAIALGIPTVVLFGPTDPEKWGFSNSRHGIIRKNLGCSPCFIFGYHKLCRSIECMSEISTKEVLALCDNLLKPGILTENCNNGPSQRHG